MAGDQGHHRAPGRQGRGKSLAGRGDGRFRLLVEEAADGIVLLDAAGRCLEANRAYCRLVGREQHELLGRALAELVQPRERGRAPALRASGTGLVEWTLVRRDGRLIPVEANIRVLADGSRLCLVRDCSGQVEVRAHLQEALGLLHQVADRLPAMIAYLGADERYRFVNTRYAEFFGRTPETTVGATLAEVIGPAAYARAHPRVAAVLAGRPQRFDNQLAPAAEPPRWLEVSYEPVQAGDGAVTGFVKLLRDISERKAEEQRTKSRVIELSRETAERSAELADRQARLQAVFETAADAIITIDEGGRIESWNPAAERMFGYGVDEAVGRDVAMLLPSPHREQHGAYLARYLATGERHIIGSTRELEAVRRDGTVFPMELSVSEARVGGRRIFTGMVRDVSARTQAEAALRSRDQELQQLRKLQAVGQFTGGIAHDFGNIISGIAMAAEVLVARLAAGDPAREFGVEIRAAAQRARDLTSRLLLFARDEPIRVQPVDVASLCRQNAPLWRRLLREDIAFAVDLAEGLPPVEGDPAALQQMIWNLVVNARDAMPRGGTLRVAVGRPPDPAREGDAVVVEVADTGIGMDTPTQARIFEPFFTTKPPGQGTGLGLSTVQSVVHRLGGHIDLESAPGAGTRFRVWLPAGAGAAAHARPEPAPGPAPARRARVLVVDDEPIVRHAAAAVLRAVGHDVLEAGDGPAALALLADRSRPPDLLLADVVMPGLRGPELARRVRALVPRIRVVLMSGYDAAESGVAEAAAPFEPLLSKPFDSESLLAAVSSALARAGSR